MARISPVSAAPPSNTQTTARKLRREQYFPAWKLPALFQPLTSAQVQNRHGKEEHRHKNKDHIQHAALQQSAKPDSSTTHSVEEFALGKGDGYLRIL
jgi:hypothetical protein